jgi:hypothetical protein
MRNSCMEKEAATSSLTALLRVAEARLTSAQESLAAEVAAHAATKASKGEMSAKVMALLTTFSTELSVTVAS